MENWRAVLGLAAVSFGIYMNTLDAEFVYDDSRAILTNDDIRPQSSWGNLLLNDFWGTELKHSGSHKSYRPLTVATFKINYLVAQLQPFGYHLVNVLLHCFCTVLVYILSRKFLQVPSTAEFSGLLFALHPVHTEAVAGVVGRADLLTTAFFISALLSYMKHLETSKDKHLIATILLTFGALFSKEHGITALGVCVLYDLLLHSRLNLSDLITASVWLKPEHRALRRRLLILVSFGAISLLFRLWLMEFKSPSFSPSDNPAAHSSAFLTRLLTFAHLPIINMQMLLFPKTLSFDWSMDSIPLVHSLLDSRAMITVAIYSMLAYCSYKLTNRRRAFPPSSAKRSPSPTFDINANPLKSIPNNNNGSKIPPNICPDPKCASPVRNGYKLKFKGAHLVLAVRNDCSYLMDAAIFGIIIATVSFAPATNLLAYVGFVIAERVLYLPSVGYCIIVAAGLEYLLVSKRIQRRLVTVGALATLVIFGTKTWCRNYDWKNEEALYKSGIAVNPAKAYSNLGNVFSRQKRVEEAENAYRNALYFRPNMADTHYNLGHLLQEQNRLPEAIESYHNAISFRSQLAVAHLNLGLALWSSSRLPEAELRFQQCAQLSSEGLKDPKAAEHAKLSCLYNLGRLKAQQHKYSQSIEIYQSAISSLTPSYPLSPSLFNMMGEAQAKMENYQLAQYYYQKALQIKPDHVPAFLTFAHLKLKQGKISEAKELFLKATDLAPKDPSTWQHLGQFYYETDEIDNSLAAYNRANELDANNFDTVFALANLCRQKGLDSHSEQFYARAIQLRPHSSQAHANYGAILHLNKKYNEAKTQYVLALNLNPDDKLTRENYNKLLRVIKE